MKRNLALPVLCLLLIGCNSRVPLPTSDSTPPSLSWSVFNQTTKAGQDLPLGGAYQAKGSESLQITLRVRDPEGVSYVELSGGYTKNCVDANGLGSVSQGTLAGGSQSFGPDSNNQVPALGVQTLTLPADISCQGGDQWVSTAVTVKGLGRNFFSGQAQDYITITFLPSARSRLIPTRPRECRSGPDRLSGCADVQI